MRTVKRDEYLEPPDNVSVCYLWLSQGGACHRVLSLNSSAYMLPDRSVMVF